MDITIDITFHYPWYEASPVLHSSGSVDESNDSLGEMWTVTILLTSAWSNF